MAPGAIVPSRPSCFNILAGFIVACLSKVGESSTAARTVNSSIEGVSKGTEAYGDGTYTDQSEVPALR